MECRQACLLGLAIVMACLGGALAAGSPPAPAKGQGAQSGLPQMPKNYPFPQCWTTTQSYDIDFVGPLKRMTIDGITFGYHLFGPTEPSQPQQKPVVLLPGLGTSMYIWPIPLLQRMAYDRPVLIFDFPKLGESKNATLNEPYSIAMLGRTTIGLIRGMKFGGKPDLLGWGLGGMVALNMAGAYSQELGSIIVYGGSAGGSKSFQAPQSAWKSFLGIRRGDTEGVAKSMFPDGLQDRGMCSLYASWNSFYKSKYTNVERLTARGEEVVLEQALAMANFYRDNTTYRALRSSTNRLLLMHGLEDRVVPVRNAVVAASRVVSSWAVQVPRSGHGMLFENVKGTIAVTLEFFAQAAQDLLTSADLKWYEYGEHVPPSAPLTLTDVKKVVGDLYWTPVKPQDMGNATGFLARLQVERKQDMDMGGGN